MGQSLLRRIVRPARLSVVLAAVGSAAVLVAACPASTAPAVSAVISSTAGSTAGVSAPTDWPTYHGDGIRSGYASTLKTVATAPKHVWSVKLDGAVYGSPIVVDNNMKIVVTENDTVYRISADRVVWRHHIGTPVPTSMLQCGDIDPTGITGTPAYDAATNTIVVVAFVYGPFRHIAVGLDPVTGAQRWGRIVDVPGSVTGISPQAMQQRGALLIAGRRLYVPYGGLAGDCSSYRGSLVGVDLDHPMVTPLWHFTVPTSREGGIWTPPGPSANPGGGILVAVGNGATTSTGNYDYSDSILKLSSQGIADYFAPSGWRGDNGSDLDLGSQGPAVVGNWVFADGKGDTAYVLNRGHLGGIGGQVSAQTMCNSFGGTAVLGSVVYVPCTDGLRAVRINSNGSMTVLWHAASNITGSPVIGGGKLWALDTGAGVLHVMNPATGADVYRLSVGPVNRFATPALSVNAVFVGTLSGVQAFNW